MIKEYWKYKDYFIFQKKGHKSSHFPNNKLNEYDKDKKRTSVSSNNIVKKLKKEINTMKKNFKSVNTEIAQLKKLVSAYQIQILKRNLTFNIPVVTSEAYLPGCTTGC